MLSAREHHHASRWVRACEEYAAADRATPLAVDDLEAWRESAQVVGRIDEALTILLTRRFELRAEAGALHAATCATYWLWSAHIFARGEYATAAGWVERARTLAEERVSGEYGWLLIPRAYGCIGKGDYATAEGLLHRATELGLGRGDVDRSSSPPRLVAVPRSSWGSLEPGPALLDQAMVRILTGATSPRTTSVRYCAAIRLVLYEVQEIARATEWSVALDHWLGTLPRLGGAYFGKLPDLSRDPDAPARGLASG